MVWTVKTELVRQVGTVSTQSTCLTSGTPLDQVPEKVLEHVQSLVGRALHQWQGQGINLVLLIKVVEPDPLSERSSCNASVPCSE